MVDSEAEQKASFRERTRGDLKEIWEAVCVQLALLVSEGY
jgi:hypothetical protein